MDKYDKFNKFEKIFFRIHTVSFIIGLFLLSLLYFAQDTFESIARTFLVVAYSFFYVVFANFIISIVRLFKYLFSFRKSQDMVTIKRTVAIMFTSPISLGIYLIIMLAMSLSLSSCS